MLTPANASAPAIPPKHILTQVGDEDSPSDTASPIAKPAIEPLAMRDGDLNALSSLDAKDWLPSKLSTIVLTSGKDTAKANGISSRGSEFANFATDSDWTKKPAI